MRKYIMILSSTLVLMLMIGCDSKKLEDMGDGYRAHIRNFDQENLMNTELEAVVPISFVKLTDEEKIEERDAYLAKIYVVSKSWYIGSSRVYNVNDTLDMYFDKNRNFIRLKE